MNARLAHVIARTAARKAAGQIPDYSRHRKEGGAAAPKSSGRTALPVLPCVHEGPVVEACKGCRSEARHVRACLHPSPSADRDTCTREYVSGKVQACDRCPDREPARS